MDGLRPSIAPQLCKPLYFLKASHPAWLASAHTCLEEAALAFSACGITGPGVADLPYQTGDVPDASSGNIMGHLVGRTVASGRSEEHTSELQSRPHLVCRLLLEK